MGPRSLGGTVPYESHSVKFDQRTLSGLKQKMKNLSKVNINFDTVRRVLRRKKGRERVGETVINGCVTMGEERKWACDRIEREKDVGVI